MFAEALVTDRSHRINSNFVESKLPCAPGYMEMYYGVYALSKGHNDYFHMNRGVPQF